MRAYLAAYETKLIEMDGPNPSHQTAKWLAWAKAYVESQDPLSQDVVTAA